MDFLITSRMKRFLEIATLVLAAQVASGQRWVQWNSAQGGNNHYYALTLAPTNWAAAQKLALAWGGTLATITSPNEQNFINETFLTGEYEHLPLWIGLARTPTKHAFSGSLGPLHVQIGSNQNADFRWVTGEPFSYSNWKPGEPNNTPPGEDYVVINWEYSDEPPRGLKGDWNDTPLNGTTRYGGKTDGPYFGLVERNTDPNRPARAGLTRFAACTSLITLLIVLVVVLVLKSRAGQRV